jgi:hypothetical protein
VELGELLRTFGTPTLGGLLGLCVLLILTGRLVPSPTVKKLLDVERARADREAARADKLTEQVDLLLGVAHTAEAVLKSLPRPPDRGQT